MISEFEQIRDALFTDPYDQSLWFYHGYLMGNLETSSEHASIVPSMTTDSRLNYVVKELETMQELCKQAEDSKWAYLALLQYTRLEWCLRGQPLDGVRNDMTAWLKELRRLDPLRRGRWDDLSRTLGL